MRKGSGIWRLCGVAFCLSVFYSGAWSQERSIGNAIHEMGYQIAGEVLGSAGLSASDSVSIRLEATTPPTYLENAFLRALSEQSIHVMRPSSGTNQRKIIHLLVLEQEVQYGAIDSSRWDRMISLVVEVRIDHPNGTVNYLGKYSRRASDLVDARESWPSQIGEFHVGRSESTSSLFKLLGPVLAITGTVIMIYLFFTVRS